MLESAGERGNEEIEKVKKEPIGANPSGSLESKPNVNNALQGASQRTTSAEDSPSACSTSRSIN